MQRSCGIIMTESGTETCSLGLLRRAVQLFFQSSGCVTGIVPNTDFVLFDCISGRFNESLHLLSQKYEEMRGWLKIFAQY